MSTMEVVVATENTDSHVCHPPAQYGGRSVARDRSEHGLDSVAKCECGRYWVLRYGYSEDSYRWTPLRWYHRTAWRLLKEQVGVARS